MQSSKGSWKIVHVRLFTVIMHELGGNWPRAGSPQRFQKDRCPRPLQPEIQTLSGP